MAKAISETMRAALNKAYTCGDGFLERRPGGFWTYPGCSWCGNAPQWYVGTSTINALIDRELVTVAQWQEGRRGQFPILIYTLDAHK